ncbi:MAG: DNA recombination protein RmuC [Endomicrobiaceae bacterium]|jgi:DNA recombination protein RmuC|nr:DNA recombination protein RmuC [Endomicrobiaceae bacterium]MDD3729536.1 DNA recombination protein RmuC [Endomicrobiaceae bacterium]MDD4165442.1 DNA recombination protein RmuC [Endomicrobiaceae bacterium]
MEFILTAIFALLGVTVGFLIASKRNDISFIKNELTKKEESIKALNAKIEELSSQNKEFELVNKQITVEKEHLEKYKTDLEKIHEQNKINFENLTNKIFEETREKIKSANEESLTNILKPVRSNIEDFQKQVSEFVKQDTVREGILKEKLENLVAKTNDVSAGAAQLANAIKGESVVRGFWGEETLIEILKNSGLIVGKNLFIQTQQKDNKRTDIMIKLPSGNTIVIDAKTIFIDYQNYINKSDYKEKQEYLKKHIKQIKEIIDDLSGKRYPEKLQETSELVEPDFTLMFVNPESALTAACQEEPDLTVTAWKKKVALVSASSLINTINMIVKLWDLKIQSDEIESIKENANKLVVEFNNFLINFTKACNKVDEAAEMLSIAKNHIDGNAGSLIQTAQKVANIYPNQMTQKNKKFIQSQGYDYDGNRK